MVVPMVMVFVVGLFIYSYIQNILNPKNLDNIFAENQQWNKI